MPTRFVPPERQRRWNVAPVGSLPGPCCCHCLSRCLSPTNKCEPPLSNRVGSLPLISRPLLIHVSTRCGDEASTLPHPFGCQSLRSEHIRSAALDISRDARPACRFPQRQPFHFNLSHRLRDSPSTPEPTCHYSECSSLNSFLGIYDSTATAFKPTIFFAFVSRLTT